VRETNHEAQRSPFFGVIRRLDDALYAIEGTVVTVFVVLMTLMVSADVVQRRVADPKSKIGSLLARLFGVDDPETVLLFEETGGNVIVGVGLVALIVFGIYSAEKGRERRGEAFEQTRVIVGSGLGVLFAGALAYLVGNPDIPSRVFFASAFGLAGLGLLLSTLRKKPSQWPLRAAAIVLASAGLVAFAVSFIPEGYTWSKKVSLLLLMWVAFLGASMCAHDGKHLRLEALARLVPARISPYVEALGALVTMLICTFFAWLVGVEVFAPETGLRAMGELIEMTEIPAWIRIFSAVVGFAILGLRYLGVAGSALLGGDYGKPRSELEEVLESAEVKP
jgi:TRAP-type C4-dicarboxylate transport system permease small subunit